MTPNRYATPHSQTASCSSRPPVVAWLGYGGLLPFVAAAVMGQMEPNHPALWLQMLLTYGTVILSFVGALHWGFVMSMGAASRPNASAMYVWSVVPPLMAWLALLLPHPFGVIVLLAGFLTHYWQDTRVARVLTLPEWYLPFRLRLTLVAGICLASTLFLQAGKQVPGFSV